MKVITFETEEHWKGWRMGKITGSKAGDITPKRDGSKKIGFYELIAERIATDPYGLAFAENPMERGKRLEKEAVERFAQETGKKVDWSLVGWESDEDSSIALSPDGVIGKTEAIEAKCLSCARHIEAFLTQEVPDEFEYQMLQYFVVNEKLKTLYFVFYDPRIPAKDFFYLTIKRKDVAARIASLLEMQKKTLEEVNVIVTQLTL